MTRLRRHAGVRLHDATLLGAWFRPYGETLHALDGAVEVLRELKGCELRVGLVSNVPLPGVFYRRILARYGMAGLIDTFHFSYDEGSRKPSPAMVRQALATLEVPAKAALMVGDRRSSDVAAGRAAGVETVWLRSEDGGGPAPAHTIDHLSELPALAGRRAKR